MVEILASPPTVLGRWRAGSISVLRSVWSRGEQAAIPAEATDELLGAIDAADALSHRLTEQMSASSDSQVLANAASICRWELVILRERVLELDMPSPLQSLRTRIVRHLDGAASAARLLSSGYRFHHIDRICDGGQALDDHLESVRTLRSRLAA